MRDKNRTKRWLLDWFERNNLTPTMNHKKDLKVFEGKAKMPKFEHEVKK